MSRVGELTGRVKDAWLTATVPVFTIDGVIDMDDSLSNNFFNAVKVTSSGDNSALIPAVREITDRGNPLNIYDMGRRVYEHDSPLHTTQAQLNSAADTMLTRVSTRQAKTVKVTCLPQPQLDLPHSHGSQHVQFGG